MTSRTTPSMDYYPGVTKHAREQMLARHGIDPTREEWRGIVADILERRACMMAANMPGGRQKWGVTVRGVAAVLIWCPDTAMVITVIPRNGGTLHPATVRSYSNAVRGRISRKPEQTRAHPRAWMEEDE